MPRFPEPEPHTPNSQIASNQTSSTRRITPRLLHVCWRQRLHHTGTLAEARSEDTIGILEHAILETDDDELRALESRLDEATDVLGVGQIESGVDFVKNVHRCWLELEKSHNQGESHK